MPVVVVSIEAITFVSLGPSVTEGLVLAEGAEVLLGLAIDETGRR